MKENDIPGITPHLVYVFDLKRIINVFLENCLYSKKILDFYLVLNLYLNFGFSANYVNVNYKMVKARTVSYVNRKVKNIYLIITNFLKKEIFNTNLKHKVTVSTENLRHKFSLDREFYRGFYNFCVCCFLYRSGPISYSTLKHFYLRKRSE